MRAPLVSWVLPVYHSKPEQLDECLDSIMRQTYPHWELIIVMDEPTEAEKEIVNTYRKKDFCPPFIVIENPKRIGLTGSLNAGVKTAGGKYIARMDADDISYPDRLSKQVEYMESHPEVGICGTAVRRIYDGASQNVTYPVNHSSILAMMMLWGCALVHPSVIMRTDFIKQFPGPYDDEVFNFAEDFCLWIKCIGKTRFHNLEETLLVYRSDGTNICAVNRKEQEAQIAELRGKTADAVGLPRQGDRSLILWLHHLFTENSYHERIPKKSFNRILAEVFYNECLHNAAEDGMDTWSYFYGSPLSAHIPMPLPRAIKFVLVCILRKKFKRATD